MRLTVIGCTGSMPGPDSPASCYLVQADDTGGRTWSVLLDLGNGALGALQRVLPPQDLDAVLLSHLHADHCLDVCPLYVHEKYAPSGRRDVPLPVVGPEGVATRLTGAYGSGEESQMAGTLGFAEWTPGEPLVIGPLTITPFPVLHPVPAMALRVEAGGRVLTYSGDTDSCPGLVQALRGADVALVEAAFVDGVDETRGIHLSGSRAAQACVDAGGVGRLLLTHVPPWKDPAVALQQARAVVPGAGLARPGQVVDV